jgi:quinol monooxygenase YgiN
MTNTTTARITVIARIKARPGMEERVRQELLKLLGPTRAEKGCINYDMHEAVDDPSSFLFHENWASEDDLQRHLQTPHLRHWFAQSTTLLAGPVEISRWTRVG